MSLTKKKSILSKGDKPNKEVKRMSVAMAFDEARRKMKKEKKKCQ